MNTAQRVTLVLMVVAIGAAVTFAFLPLPGQTFGGEPATCGPGSSSASAVYVKLFPDSVVTGEAPSNATQQALVKAFEGQCQGVANTRLWTVGVVTVAGFVVGLLVFAILDDSRQRDARRGPAPPWPSPPPPPP